jgi:molybdenum cofactor cytidylyltransferase
MIAVLIPAAGRSERMGRPKLTLPIHGTPLIVRVVGAFFRGGAERVLIVVPPESVPGASLLADEARDAGAEVVVAQQPPPDMRASVELGLARLSEGPPPTTLLLAPGDSPGLSPELVARVIAQAKADPRAIVRPEVGGRGGHPIALPWSLATEIPRLAPGAGVNALVRAHPEKVIALEVDDPGATADLDTPEDYARWTGRRGDRESIP